MVSNIYNAEQIFFQPSFSANKQVFSEDTYEPLNSFADEDEAIISSEAKLLSELEKFNSGNGDAVNLALTGIMTEFTVDAQVNVVNTKKHMIDEVLKIGE